MPLFELSFASGEESLSLRRFSIHEAMSELWSVSIWARSPNEDLDLEALVGRPASFRFESGVKFLGRTHRRFMGVCSTVEMIETEPDGLSTYFLRIEPKLWLLTQRINHRVFQHLSIPDIVDKLLTEWQIPAVWRVDRPQYPPLELRMQYGESDFAFLSRLLEEAGIAWSFRDHEERGTELVLDDAAQTAEARAGGAIRFVDNPNQSAEKEFVTEVRLTHAVKRGRHVIRDFDFRRSIEYPLFGDSGKSSSHEELLEHYEYRPGAFLVEGNKGGDDVPVGDDQGVARHLDRTGRGLAERILAAERVMKRIITFETNVPDLAPGVVFSMAHPRRDLQPENKLLIIELTSSGAPGDEWHYHGQAVFADVPYRPQLKTPKPNVTAVQSAVVTGPAGEEIHTDELGRVRVQFPWDREGRYDDRSSCWMRVSQGWAGATYGMQLIPRVGHEVLVSFLDGNPDQPVIVGRLHNNTSRPPYKLPKRKTRSTWKSDSTPGSNGFNEIMFEDLKGQELVYVQAERDQKKLVKVDEAITVGRSRQKLVKLDETERTNRDRHVTVDRHHRKLVKGDETERTRGEHRKTVEQDQDLVVQRDKRERVEMNSHLEIRRNRSEEVGGIHSLIVGDGLQIRVGNNHAVDAGEEIHVRAGMRVVIEAGARLTFKGPGGFIDIDDDGVVIQGKVVRINSGGSAGSGAGVHTHEPAEAREAEPGDPEVEDVFKREHE